MLQLYEMMPISFSELYCSKINFMYDGFKAHFSAILLYEQNAKSASEKDLFQTFSFEFLCWTYI